MSIVGAFRIKKLNLLEKRVHCENTSSFAMLMTWDRWLGSTGLPPFNSFLSPLHAVYTFYTYPSLSMPEKKEEISNINIYKNKTLPPSPAYKRSRHAPSTVSSAINSIHDKKGTHVR